ncbi:MAG: hypothetical protein ACKN9M_00395 [Burkholderiaceae bacterium]
MRRSNFIFQAALLPTLWVASSAVWAARPFVTDDARLTTASSCQLESWARIYPNSQELWALPACNPTGDLEFTVGGGVAKLDGSAGWTDDYVLQAKTLFKKLEPNGWGVGAAVGTIQHPQINPGPNLLGNRYAYVPLSMSFADDLVVVHLNGGWLRDKATGKDQTTWGIGTELNLNPHLTLIAESFGNSVDRPYWQAGTRYSVIPGLFQIDATVGRQYGAAGDHRWLSFGVRFTPEKIF